MTKNSFVVEVTFKTLNSTRIFSHENIFVNLIKTLTEAAIGNMGALSVSNKSQEISTMAKS